jgi:hypothetical protein
VSIIRRLPASALVIGALIIGALVAAPTAGADETVEPPPVVQPADPVGEEVVAPSNPETLVYSAPESTEEQVADADTPPCPVGPDVGTDALPALDGPPPLVDAWFNTQTDFPTRGNWDPNNHRPWIFPQRISQLICGATPGSTVRMGMYFIRATNDSNATEIGRPESDANVVYEAMEWLAKYRNVKVQVVLDNTNTCATAPPGQSCTHIMTPSARRAVEQRFSKIPGRQVVYCVNGCFNQMRYGVNTYGIEHEKFITISDTNFGGSYASPDATDSAGQHPVVISSSANLARSQIRNYHQEASEIYDDQEAWRQFDVRFQGMWSCALDYCSKLGDPATHTIGAPGYVGPADPGGRALVQEPGRKIWADPFLYRHTDPGRGTRITFAPQRDVPDSDVFIHQFDNVDCDVQDKIRIAMFKLTDAKADEMVRTLRQLKARGCDIKMLMSTSEGQTVVSPSVSSALKNAKIDFACTQIAMHTKMISIGPMSGPLGSVLTGTANMSVAGQLYSEEHILTFDAVRAVGAAQQAMKRVYNQYLAEWYRLWYDHSTQGNC